MNDILEYKDYCAKIHFSAKDEIFYGRLVGIDDLISFEGDCVKELKEAFHEAVDDYIETCKELDKEPDKTYKGNLNVQVPVELHRQLVIFAAIRKISLADFVTYALDKTIAEEKKHVQHI